MKSTLISITVFLFAFSSIAVSQKTVVTTKIHGQEYSLATADGLKLYAWLTPSPHENAPLVVLLPMMGNTHHSYSPFIKAVFERFKTPDSTRTMQAIPHFLSLDLRGHGQSTQMGEKTLNYRMMEPEDFAPYPSDVKAMIEKVLGDKKVSIDRQNIIIIGASIGANSSVMAAETLTSVKKVVMLSPGESYRQLEPGPSLAKFAGEVLILAGMDDAYSKTSSEKLAALKKSGCTLKTYPGPYHGTDLIDNSPEAMKLLIDWLVN
ncbi:MAG: alpha/beta fold hydrolase [Candidatus Zixiibacteriota bacterium]|nr:MAG: alpha/beta fold hydrolase [candidate division Zixibacteria bacterium]